MTRSSPEEIIRQALIKKMVEEKGYPKECITIEKALNQLPHLKGKTVPKRRFDVVCFSSKVHPTIELFPLLLVECKAIDLKRDALSQIVGYNFHVEAFSIALVNAYTIVTGCRVKKGGYQFTKELFSYQELIEKAKAYYG